MYDLAIYVLTTGNRPFLPQTLQSIFAQLEAESELRAFVDVVDNASDEEAVLRLLPFRPRLRRILLHSRNLGIPPGWDSILPAVPESSYALLSEDDVEYRRPFSTYLRFLRANPEIGLATGQHSPEHPLSGQIEHEGLHWLLKPTERGTSLLFRAEDLAQYRPFPNSQLDMDWWICRDAPNSLIRRGRQLAVLPGGVRHLAPQGDLSNWGRGDCEEYACEQLDRWAAGG